MICSQDADDACPPVPEAFDVDLFTYELDRL
jgi:hypothetical protein